MEQKANRHRMGQSGQQRRGVQGRRGEPLRRRRSQRRTPEHLRYRQEHFFLAVWYGYRDVFDFVFPHPMDVVNWADDAYEMTLIRIPVFIVYLPVYYVLLLALAVIGVPLSLLITGLRFLLR